jgi:hypothetical protein
MSPEEVRQSGGRALLDIMFDGSLSKLLHSVYPDHKWFPWVFRERAPLRFWDDMGNQKAFMNWLGEELDFHTLDNWYNIKQETIITKGGVTLLNKYLGSPIKLLQSIYPEHYWMIWKFSIVPTGYWDKPQNRKEFVDWMGSEFGFTKLEDWYNITRNQIKEKGGSTLLRKQDNSLIKLLQSVYPEHNWKKTNNFH